jgi:hypothetical protein
MTESMIASAKELLAGGTPQSALQKTLAFSVPTLHRWVRGCNDA